MHEHRRRKRHDRTPIPPSPRREPSASTTNRRQPFGRASSTRSRPAGPSARTTSAPREQAPFAAARRAAVSAAFPGKRLVVPAGALKQRSNDTDYPFRAHSAFAHLTGWASDAEPDSVLVFDPHRTGPRRHPLLPRARRPHHERVLRGCLDRRVLDRPAARPRRRRRGPRGRDRAHRRIRRRSRRSRRRRGRGPHRFVSELRLIKDDYEIARCSSPWTSPRDGFDDIIANLPRILEHPRGERIVEGVFHRRARSDGNGWATTPSPHPARTPATCTGRATTAPSCRAT